MPSSLSKTHTVYREIWILMVWLRSNLVRCDVNYRKLVFIDLHVMSRFHRNVCSLLSVHSSLYRTRLSCHTQSRNTQVHWPSTSNRRQTVTCLCRNNCCSRRRNHRSPAPTVQPAPDCTGSAQPFCIQAHPVSSQSNFEQWVSEQLSENSFSPRRSRSFVCTFVRSSWFVAVTYECRRPEKNFVVCVNRVSFVWRRSSNRLCARTRSARMTGWDTLTSFRPSSTRRHDVVTVAATAAAVRGPCGSHDDAGTERRAYGAARQPDRPRSRRQRLRPRGAVQRPPQHRHQSPAVQLLQEPQAAGQFLPTAGPQVDTEPRSFSVVTGAAASSDARQRSGLDDSRADSAAAATAGFQVCVQQWQFVDVRRRVQRWPDDAVQKLGNGVEKLSALFLEVSEAGS